MSCLKPSIVACGLAACLAVVASSVDAAISGSAYGEAYRSNALIQQNSELLGNAPDSETDVVTAEADYSVGLAKSLAKLSSGAIGASAASSASGEEVVVFGSPGYMRYSAKGVGQVQYVDQLTITSDTLPAGTPVAVEFCWAVDLVLNVEHTSTYNADNYASGSGTLTFNVGAVYPQLGFSRFSTAILTAGGLPNLQGVWASGSDSAVVQTTVGSQLTLNIALTANATTLASGYFSAPNVPELHNGSAEFCAALVFGAAADVDGVTIMSQYTGQPFAARDTCEPSDATPFIPVLPEPSSAVILMIGLTAAIGHRRA